MSSFFGTRAFCRRSSWLDFLKPNVVKSDKSLDAPTQIGAVDLAPSVPDSEIATSLPSYAGYEVLRELGRGGMGVVYLAKDLGLDRLVALKTFQVDDDNTLKDILSEEARVAGKLDHPTIVPVFEVNAEVHPPYFTMAFVDGEDLAHRISRQVLGARDAAVLGLKVADALACAHAADVYHLDIKPANILLDRKGEPRITDFGLFALLGSNSDCRGAGTPQFMSPEQAACQTDAYCSATDVYSLGAVMFAALAGRPPIVSSNERDLVFKVLSRRPKPLRTYGLRIPPALDAIVMKCLEKEPSRRYSSPGELHADLERFLQGKPVRARPMGAWDNLLCYVQQHVLASVSGSFVIALLLAVSALLYSSFRQRWELEADLLSAENVIRNQSTQFHNALKKHSGRTIQLRVTADVEADMARDLYTHGNLEMAAKCAAQAIVATAELGQDAPLDTGRIVREFLDSQQLFPGNSEDESSNSGADKITEKSDFELAKWLIEYEQQAAVVATADAGANPN